MATKTLYMYDSIVNDIPADAEAIAGYVAGNWPTFNEAWFQNSPAKYKLSIAIRANEDAHALDVEPGDVSPTDTNGIASWVLRQMARGVYRPWVYASASNVDGIVQGLTSHGVHRLDYRIWSAHYTGVPHLCGPSTCRECVAQANVTQYTDRAHGANLDESLVSAGSFSFTAPDPHPEYRILDTMHRHLAGASSKGGISELGRIKAYDVYKARGLEASPAVRKDIGLLFARLWDVVHHPRVGPPAAVGSELAKKRWAQYNRGARGKILRTASLGKR
ncbi:MAG TPA: hypothetical protein VIK30_13865 [Polyangia bacterium]